MLQGSFRPWFYVWPAVCCWIPCCKVASGLAFTCGSLSVAGFRLRYPDVRTEQPATVKPEGVYVTQACCWNCVACGWACTSSLLPELRSPRACASSQLLELHSPLLELHGLLLGLRFKVDPGLGFTCAPWSVAGSPSQVPGAQHGGHGGVRAAGRSTPPPWWSIRFRLALRTYAPCGPSAREVSQTKSRKIPTRNISPLFFAQVQRRDQGVDYPLPTTFALLATRMTLRRVTPGAFVIVTKRCPLPVISVRSCFE